MADTLIDKAREIAAIEDAAHQFAEPPYVIYEGKP